ncbi:cytochrome P450 4c3-like isoform X1 [Haemaphysalis longicornis]
MTGISQHGLYLLSMDSLLEISSCAIITFLIMAASSAVLVGSLIWVSRIIQSKTVKRLQGLPYIRQHFPFQQQWIFMNACDQPMAPVGFSTMVFATVSGFHAVFQRFGRYVVYLGFRPLVILFKAEYVEEVLSSNKLLTKGDEYEFLHGWLGTGLLTSAGEKWRSRRRLFTPAFHFRILDDFMGTINAQSFILAAKLGELCLAKQPFDVLPVVTMCTLDTICETVMGTTINAQSNTSSPYVKAVDRLGEIVLERMFRPLLHVNFIFQLLSVGREHRKCLKTLHSFTRKVIAERKASLRKEIDSGLVTLEDDAASNNGGRKTPRPFMDLLLLEHLKGNITEDGIREEVDTFMFGGHDTTGVGISWALFLIGHHPEKQQLIHDELDFIFGDDKDRYVNPEDLKQMKYLECALKESQRVYPSVPFISRTCTEPVTIGGVELPENSVIQIATYFLHRDPKVFPKPEEFIPERFLPENAKGRHPYAYVPFSAGPRNCIGQKYALAEEKIVIANILRRFKIKSLNQRDQVALAAEIVLKPRSDLRIEFTPR